MCIATRDNIHLIEDQGAGRVPNPVPAPGPRVRPADHSGLMPANLTTLAHMSVSVAMGFPSHLLTDSVMYITDNASQLKHNRQSQQG